MKTYRELNLEEKTDLEKIISEVIELLPKNNDFFSSEKTDDNGNKILKTKQDYNEDKNSILQIIEKNRLDGIISNQKSKEMKISITILFNEFIRISPRKIYQIKNENDEQAKISEDEQIREKEKRKAHIDNISQMKTGELYIKIQGTYIKLPEKVIYKIIDNPANDEIQTLQYIIISDDKAQEVKKR